MDTSIQAYRHWLGTLSNCERDALVSTLFNTTLIIGLVAAVFFAPYLFFIAGGFGIVGVILSI